MKKNSKLIINISTEEKEKLKAIAREFDLPLNKYCLLVLKNKPEKIILGRKK